jgi:hypothetical protein
MTRILVAVVSVMLLASCRVDINTSINVADNGSGLITVSIAADAATVRAAPELADSLNLDDLRAIGWDATVQTDRADGGLLVVLSRSFATTDQATSLLQQLSGDNGPLRELTITRNGNRNDATFTFSGQGGLPEGLAGFADTEALSVLGGAPFAQSLAASGASLSDTLGVALRITLPGEMLDSNGEAMPRTSDDQSSTIAWNVPVDGTDVVMAASTRNRDVAASIASVSARVLLVLLIVLAVAAIVYITTVIRRRTRTTPAP